MNENDTRTMLDKATGAVQDAADAVQQTTESIVNAIEDSRRPGGVLDQVTRITRESPLRSLALGVHGWLDCRAQAVGGDRLSAHSVAARRRGASTLACSLSDDRRIPSLCEDRMAAGFVVLMRREFGDRSSLDS